MHEIQLPDELNPKVVKANAEFHRQDHRCVPPPHNALTPESYGDCARLLARLYKTRARILHSPRRVLLQRQWPRRGWDTMWRNFMQRVLKETKKRNTSQSTICAKCASDAETLEHAQALLAHADGKMME